VSKAKKKINRTFDFGSSTFFLACGHFLIFFSGLGQGTVQGLFLFGLRTLPNFLPASCAQGVPTREGPGLEQNCVTDEAGTRLRVKGLD